LIANVTAFIIYKVMSQELASENLSGVYNLSSAGEVSWYGFARALIKEAHDMSYQLKCTPENITPIGTKDYPTPARRPLHSKLDAAKLENKFNLAMPRWDLYIKPSLEDLKIVGII
jgi:dTDP-4-dehydrorhamnose reductase